MKYFRKEYASNERLQQQTLTLLPNTLMQSWLHLHTRSRQQVRPGSDFNSALFFVNKHHIQPTHFDIQKAYKSSDNRRSRLMFTKNNAVVLLDERP
jgi:hypothetical protein